MVKRGRECTVSAIQEARSWLHAELDRWGESDLRADFWWRDDDAVSANTQLERLLHLSARHSAPLALAVIPERLEPSLGVELHNHSGVSVLQHGYSHQSHAAPGERKLELGGARASDDIINDLRKGQQILQQHFSRRFIPVLVPPWNRIDPHIVKALPTIGFTGLSTMRVRRNAWPATGLRQVNTHLDPVNWRHKGGFIGLYPAIAVLIQHLVARRSGYRDFDEPTGLLTHHLVQNEAVWRFLDDLMALLSAHPAVNWIDAPSIWKKPSAN
jgi:hypothetical protein